MSEHISIPAVQDILGYVFREPSGLWRALQAAGSRIGGQDGNRTLAMVGDAVIRLILVHDLAATGVSRGTIDSTVQGIVSNDNLAQMCNDAGITQYINGNPSHVGAQGRNTRAATVEAIMAAVYYDSGKNLGPVRDAMGFLGLSPNGTS